MKYITPAIRSVVCFAVLVVAAHAVRAQTAEDAAKDVIVKALTLYQQGRYAEAVPYMEILVQAAGDSPEIHFAYGVCLIGKSKQVRDTAEAKQLTQKALEQLLKAKELGLKSDQNESLIGMLTGKAASSADKPVYSSNKEAEQTMMEAENLFVQSNYDDAIKKFEKVLALDPTVYRAALGAGDCYTAKGDWSNAEKLYQKGIAIDPNKETAYRYSATPLMKQQKYDLARDRYIEAFITEPYSDLARRGITQWAQQTGVKIGHPPIRSLEVSFDSNGKAITRSAIDAGDPIAKPWLAYISTLEAWKKEKFAKAFPKETAYRHSLPEEAEALRAVVAAGVEQRSTDPQLKLIAKMDADGVLEAYILMARADEGIAADHPDFLKNNRTKLRQYVANYVISK